VVTDEYSERTDAAGYDRANGAKSPSAINPRGDVVMPGLFQKVSQFLKSPQGRKYSDQAKRYASDPKNRDKAQQMLKKFRGGKGGAH
jgi:hypothetical protein